MSTIEDLAAPFLAVAAEYGIVLQREHARSRLFRVERQRPDIKLMFTAKTKTVSIEYKMLKLMMGSGVERIELWVDRPAAFDARLETDYSDGSAWKWEIGAYEGQVADAVGVFKELCAAYQRSGIDMN